MGPQMTSSPPLSPVRFAGRLAFVSGQLPRGTDGRIIEGNAIEQVRQSLENLQSVLGSAGLTLLNVVKVTAWLTDPSHMADFNAVYREYFSEPFPARSVVISGLVAPGAVVEIEALAELPENAD
jgi:2-iminobutanoate/2-iminopropanoate deaminase